MADDFRLLTMQAFPSPSGDVLIHGWPDNFGANGLARALDARVAEAVDGIKDHLAECQRNEWPCGAIADIHYETRAADVDVLKVESGSCIIPESAELRVERLLCRDGIPINAE